MLTDDEIAFLRRRLDEEAAAAWAVHDVSKCDALPYKEAADTPDCGCGHPARVLREVSVWRKLLLEYQSAPLDAVYDGTEREAGFRLALSAALKAKIATYDGNPVTGEPFPANPASAGRGEGKRAPYLDGAPTNLEIREAGPPG
jgi:hypothetical protein